MKLSSYHPQLLGIKQAVRRRRIKGAICTVSVILQSVVERGLALQLHD